MKFPWAVIYWKYDFLPPAMSTYQSEKLVKEKAHDLQAQGMTVRVINLEKERQD
jgi:peptidase E